MTRILASFGLEIPLKRRFFVVVSPSARRPANLPNVGSRVPEFPRSLGNPETRRKCPGISSRGGVSSLLFRGYGTAFTPMSLCPNDLAAARPGNPVAWAPRKWREGHLGARNLGSPPRLSRCCPVRSSERSLCVEASVWVPKRKRPLDSIGTQLLGWFGSGSLEISRRTRRRREVVHAIRVATFCAIEGRWRRLAPRIR